MPPQTSDRDESLPSTPRWHHRSRDSWLWPGRPHCAASLRQRTAARQPPGPAAETPLHQKRASGAQTTAGNLPTDQSSETCLYQKTPARLLAAIRSSLRAKATPAGSTSQTFVVPRTFTEPTSPASDVDSLIRQPLRDVFSAAIGVAGSSGRRRRPL